MSLANTSSSANEDDIWSQILKESSNKTNYFEKKHVVMLGDPNAGKSLLLSKFQPISDVESLKSIALSYTFTDIFEDDTSEDPIGRINFWSLEGETAHNDLLKFALNHENIKNCMIMITLDFSQPWSLVDSLKKWLNILEDHIKSIFKDNSIGFKDLQDKLLIKWHEYVEPVAAVTTSDATSTASTTTTTSVQKKKFRKVNATPIEDTSVLPPLGENILTHNLGVPILIVCCKSDSVVMLEKDFDYKDDLFDYIQQYLRRISLQYGAGLIYTSARKEINCDVALEYLENMLFGFELKSKTQLIEKDQIFVPSGWDTYGKITLDFENQKVCKDAQELYENVVKKPSSIKRREMNQQTTITADEDQEFLQKLKSSMENEGEDMSSKLDQPSLDDKNKFDSANSSNMNNNNNSSSTGQTSTTSPTNSLRTSTGVGSTQNPEKAALANFFNSLISKEKTSRTSLSSTSLGTSTSSSSTNARLDAQKELEKLKQQPQPKK
ncbi:dynein light intermediate chain [Tieghemostelium lacteum]|uniref:Dynein light intermediate chain n=1 Tax=Tieghemostelium lacteum TaxID=361077 RepID=A0A152A5X9_TIELA|nr:dynein light intermediate chain [Tieghemostelium lacteum]|eukprot:KYR01501.1 dynein light intermediate chain [Tieghemostelium lacteum]